MIGSVLAAALLSLLTQPATAADRLPQEFAGHWCLDENAVSRHGSMANLYDVYMRSGKCDSAEHSLILGPDRFLMGGEACTILKIVSRNRVHQIQYSCRRVNGETQAAEASIQAVGRNTLFIQKDSGPQFSITCTGLLETRNGIYLFNRESRISGLNSDDEDACFGATISPNEQGCWPIRGISIKQILAICLVGKRCQIVGVLRNLSHGAYCWTEVNSVLAK
jgi:hypothetical protein